MTAPRDQQEAYHALCGCTLALGDAAFIHQYVVDAFTAQHADERTKPIALTFALVGLYLLVEHAWSGRQVQQAHVRLARRRQAWPALALPRERGAVTVADVLVEPEGPARARAIRDWCASVWGAYAANRQAVADLLRRNEVL